MVKTVLVYHKKRKQLYCPICRGFFFHGDHEAFNNEGRISIGSIGSTGTNLVCAQCGFMQKFVFSDDIPVCLLLSDEPERNRILSWLQKIIWKCQMWKGRKY